MPNTSRQPDQPEPPAFVAGPDLSLKQDLKEVRRARNKAARLAGHSLASREGLLRFLRRICESPKTKDQDKIRAAHEIAEITGAKDAAIASDVKRMSNEELFQTIDEVVVPALETAGKIVHLIEVPVAEDEEDDADGRDDFEFDVDFDEGDL